MLCCLCYFLASLFCSFNLGEQSYWYWLAPSMRVGKTVPSLAGWCLTGSKISFFSPYFLFYSFLNELTNFPSSHHLFSATYLPSEVLFWLKFSSFCNFLDPNRREYFSRKASSAWKQLNPLLFKIHMPSCILGGAWIQCIRTY